MCVCVCGVVVTIGFEQSSYEATEGMSVQVCVKVLSGTLGKGVSINFTTSDGTATGLYVLATMHEHLYSGNSLKGHL